MDPLQIFLIALGAAIMVGGVVMLIRFAQGHSSNARRPYVPLATVAVGLAIAYRSLSDYKTMDAQDITTMFVFVFALLSLLGVQFFLVDKASKDNTLSAQDDAGKKRREDPEGGNSGP